MLLNLFCEDFSNGIDNNVIKDSLTSFVLFVLFFFVFFIFCEEIK